MFDALPEALLKGAKKPKSVDYGLLRIEPRLLVAKNISIAIPNILSLEAESTFFPAFRMPNKARFWRLLACVAITVATIALTVSSAAQMRVPPLLLIASYAAGYAALHFLLVRPLPKTVETRPAYSLHTLFVRTGDSSGITFTAPKKETIDAVRKIIADKINADDDRNTYNINFENGVIENLGIGRIDTAGPIVAGHNNQVATGNGRIGTSEIVNSPGAQIGTGNISTGNTFHVDYSSMLPHVANWRQHYEAHNHGEVAARLAELERLMQGGTPAAAEKSRVQSLTRELTNLLGGAADVARFFGAIARLAGFG